jgi:hypothetical protein
VLTFSRAGPATWPSGGRRHENGRPWSAASPPGPGRVLETPRLREFTLAELRAVTRGFKPEMVLGEGGFGRVYKGWVDVRTLNPAKSTTGVVVAVKKLNPESVQGLQEWQVTQTIDQLFRFLSLLACYELILCGLFA